MVYLILIVYFVICYMILENHFLLVDFARITYDLKFPFIIIYIHKFGKELILIFDQSRVQYKIKQCIMR